MALIPFADIDSLPETARAVFERLPRKLNVFRMWANAPSCFVAGMRLGGAILAKQQLDARLRELVILLVARLEGGTYEWVQHVPIAENFGCRKDQIAALEAERLDDSCFDARDRVLLRFAGEVIRDVRASEAALQAMKAHFSPQEIVETIVTCGFYMTLARLTETTRTDIDESGGMAVLNELGRMG
ncbi:MAG: carboxymuconolactone decarboxylase family protein [Rhizomicrobium sp.]